MRRALERIRPILTGGGRPGVATVAATLAATVVGFVCWLSPVSSARAAEVTRVASGFDGPGPFEVNVSLSWSHDQKSATIKRESESASSPFGAQLTKDLVYHQSRDVMNARVEMGLWSDVAVHLDLPYVIRDDRDLGFDQGAGSGCVFPGGVGQPTCVNEQNSTLLRDGILPGAGQASYGVDATNGGQTFARPSSTVFRGPRRSGLESLGVGASWALMNQRRDPWKPTWVLGLDAKLGLGATMRYDAARPDGNTAVGLGYHQIVASTFASKAFAELEPYVGLYFVQPVRGSSSPFSAQPMGGQPHAAPQSHAGVQMGFEFVALDRPSMNQRVSLEVRGRGEHWLQGRSHSELWEALSGSSRCSTDATACRAGLDQDVSGDGRADPFPGITETQAYSTAGGDIGLDLQFSKYARFRGLFGVTYELPHFITYGSAGVDRNADGRVDSTNPSEANPVYRELIDLPGRRFKVEGTQIWNLLIQLVSVF